VGRWRFVPLYTGGYGRDSPVYTGGYGRDSPVYTLGIYTLVYTLPPYHPGYTSTLPAPGIAPSVADSAVQRGGERALGSTEEKPMGESLFNLSGAQRCERSYALLRRVTPLS